MKLVTVPPDLPEIAVPFGCWLTPARRVPVNEADLKILANRKNFAYLFIQGTVGETEVTQAALKELAAAENLSFLCISWTKVTEAAFKNWPKSRTSPRWNCVARR